MNAYLGPSIVDNTSDVRFVDSHSERNGCDDYLHLPIVPVRNLVKYFKTFTTQGDSMSTWLAQSLTVTIDTTSEHN